MKNKMETTNNKPEIGTTRDRKPVNTLTIPNKCMLARPDHISLIYWLFRMAAII